LSFILQKSATSAQSAVEGFFAYAQYFRHVIDRLSREGCDAVVLGCTEIPLLIDDRSSPLPTLDSTRILARAAIRKALP
jgi:aspartate/glutamate racemase